MMKLSLALLVFAAACGGGPDCRVACQGDATCAKGQVCRAVPIASACTSCLPAVEAKITAPASATRGAAGLAASVHSDPLLHYRWVVTGAALASDATQASITFTAGTGDSVNLACTLSNDGGDSNTVTAIVALQ